MSVTSPVGRIVVFASLLCPKRKEVDGDAVSPHRHQLESIMKQVAMPYRRCQST
jgi:hypothetical protein